MELFCVHIQIHKQCFASNIAGPYNVICSINGHPGVVLEMRHLNRFLLK